jgi:hypothetical protein
MRFALAAACTVLPLGALLGGFTASSGADAMGKIPQHTAVSASLADTIADDHGNG